MRVKITDSVYASVKTKKRITGLEYHIVFKNKKPWYVPDQTIPNNKFIVFIDAKIETILDTMCHDFDMPFGRTFDGWTCYSYSVDMFDLDLFLLQKGRTAFELTKQIKSIHKNKSHG